MTTKQRKEKITTAGRILKILGESALMILVLVCTGIMNRFGSDEEGGVVV